MLTLPKFLKVANPRNVKTSETALEERYLVLKYSDIHKLETTEIKQLFYLASLTDKARLLSGKDVLKGVFIEEEDWPEYGFVKRLLLDRINKV